MLGGVDDGKAKTIFSRVAAADGAADSSRSNSARVVTRVRAVGPGDSQLGQTDGARRRNPQRRPEDRRARRTGAAAAGEYAAKGRARDPVKSRGLVRAGGREEVEKIFFFVSAHQAMFSIRAMCRVLEVSTSGYYAWRRRLMSVQSR